MSKSVAVSEKNVSEKVLSRVQELKKTGDLVIPPGYSAENAMKSAWLILQELTDKNGNAILPTCSQASVMNALLDMVVQGLSPAKNQCYFVRYGKKLTLMRSYMGTVAVTKRLKGIKDVKAYVIYEGDIFKTKYNYTTGSLEIAEYEPEFENIDNSKIRGAFAVIIGEDGPVHLEIMNINQIKASWNMGKAKGNSKAHNSFGEEMAKKTVINRACKMYANTSDDSDILIEAMNNTDKIYSKEDIIEDVKCEVKEEIKEEANQEVIDIGDAAPAEEKKEEQEKIEVVDAEVIEEKDDGEEVPY